MRSIRKSFIGHKLHSLVISAGLLPAFVFAVNPPPDGGYAGGNTVEGTQALLSLTSGVNNTALGFRALYHDTNGSDNSAEGFAALFNNTSGINNTAQGVNALYHNSTGYSNTANGIGALFNNISGSWNSADGAFSLYSNTAGVSNTASGYTALYHVTTSGNTANGYAALYSDTTGYLNTATGFQALYSNTIASGNTAIGYWALRGNTTGISLCAVGLNALYSNSSGFYNNALGAFALFSNTTNIGNNAIGYGALYDNTGALNTAIGHSAGDQLTTGSGNVCVGAEVHGVAGESNTTRIRNVGSTAQDTGLYVTVNAVGGNKIGYVNSASSRRFKEEIKPMEKSSEALFRLNPVNFRYKYEFNPDHAERFGLIAEEVDKINPDLVSHDTEGKPLTVRYESVNAMLLNEFLKEHRKIEELEAVAAEQRKELQTVVSRLNEQALEIQKVSHQLQVNKAPRLVDNHW